MSEGIIYLIQPELLINSNKYKVGYSNDTSNQRVKSYGERARIICIYKCNNAKLVETKILNHFINKFKLVSGKEWFEGDEYIMHNDIIDIIKLNNNGIIIDNSNIDNIDNYINDSVKNIRSIYNEVKNDIDKFYNFIKDNNYLDNGDDDTSECYYSFFAEHILKKLISYNESLFAIENDYINIKKKNGITLIKSDNKWLNEQLIDIKQQIKRNYNKIYKKLRKYLPYTLEIDINTNGYNIINIDGAYIGLNDNKDTIKKSNKLVLFDNASEPWDINNYERNLNKFINEYTIVTKDRICCNIEKETIYIINGILQKYS
jgi:hypothetical protein